MNTYEERMKEICYEALELINKAECAPTELSIGYVDEDSHCRNGLVIKKCAPIVINTLIEKGFSLSMTQYGLLVSKF